MAGTNQHYIPQSLLRAFGKQGKGKEVQVAVYTPQKNFITSTRGVAAKRYFYSELSGDGTRTLDDRITEEYEPRINSILLQFHQQSAEAVDSSHAAELIAHLCIRTAQMRESFTHGTRQLLVGVAELFSDPEYRWKLLGLDRPEPSGPILEEIDKLYDQMNLALMQVQRPLFVRRAYDLMKLQMTQNPSMIDAIFAHVRNLHEGMAGVAEAGQKRALAQESAPEGRITSLASLSWRLQDYKDDLVLPDCVAIDGSSRENCRAFVYRANEDLGQVLMPISRRRLLIGTKGSDCDMTASMANAMFTMCSWQFFIAHTQAESNDALAGLIGSVTKSWFEAEIAAALAAQFSSRDA